MGRLLPRDDRAKPGAGGTVGLDAETVDLPAAPRRT